MPVSTMKSSSPPPPGCYGIGAAIPADGQKISLSDLLLEAELDQYEDALRSQLKILRAEHLRDVHESDLSEIGMSKPEQRRLMKAFQKYFPSSLAGRFKQKVLHRKANMQPAVTNSSSWNNAGTSTSFAACGLRRCNSNEEVTSAAADAKEEAKEIYAADDSQTDQGEQHIISASNIVLCRQLGKGEFGTVWQGVWTTSSYGHTFRRRNHAGAPLVKVQVAVKQINPQKMLSSSLDFVREAAIMHRIHNEFIVKFFGVVLDTQMIMLVTELAPSRSLAECLKEERSAERFSVIQLCEFAQQICSGMAYLEANRFIHRDLAARNILVFSSHKVKISDFGLSRALGTGEDYYRGNFSVNLRLPIAWCAPECINYLKFTSASDVWAYGVTLWEMFTYGFQPWAGMSGQQIFDTVNTPKMGRLECPDACPQEYYNMMLKCWQHEPENRPKFMEILSILPVIEPERVKTVKACHDGQLDHLQYGVEAVITVLNKKPMESRDGFYWKGILKNGRTGLFSPTDTVAYLESQRPGMPATNSLTITNCKKNQHKSAGALIRTAFGNFSGLTRKAGVKNSVNDGVSKERNEISRPFISHPQNDLRHTGHLGLDGMCFGDVPMQATGLTELRKTRVKQTSADNNHATIVNGNAQKERLKSYSSETVRLISPDDDYGGEDNLSLTARPCFSGGDTNMGADLDDVRPIAIDGGDSLGFFDEVLEAVDLNRSISGGCINMGAKFSAECAPEEFSIVSNAAVRQPISPTSAHDEDETEDEDSVSDKKRLWLTSSGKKDLNGYGKSNKEKSMKPLSAAETKMLDEIDRLAEKLSNKALDRERERLLEERRKYGLPDDSWQRNERRGDKSTDQYRKPTFTDTLAMKRDRNELRVSPEAENAYKTLIEGKGSTSNSILLPREERDDPQRPSVEEDLGDQSPVEDETNPLRMLRNEGANVIRRFTRQGSGRRQPLIEKPTPPVRRKHLNNGGGIKLDQNGKSSENGENHSSSIHQSETGDTRTKPPPPPVPPRSSPKASRAVTFMGTSSKDKLKPAPAIPPKPKLIGTSSNSKKMEITGPSINSSVINSCSTTNGKTSNDQCPAFTLDNVDKYELLNYVWSDIEKMAKAEERKNTTSEDKKQPTSQLSQNGQTESNSRRDNMHICTRKEILIDDDDVVHV